MHFSPAPRSQQSRRRQGRAPTFPQRPPFPAPPTPILCLSTTVTAKSSLGSSEDRLRTTGLRVFFLPALDPHLKTDMALNLPLKVTCHSPYSFPVSSLICSLFSVMMKITKPIDRTTQVEQDPDISSLRGVAGRAQGPHGPQEVAGTMEGASAWWVLGPQAGYWPG